MITSNLPHKTLTFPVGELQVTIEDSTPVRVSAQFVFEKNEDIIELMLWVDAVKRHGHTLDRLQMNYVPFSRQDRCNNVGEAFSLKVFCDLINSLGFGSVLIQDPHSDVTPALLNNCIVTPQWQLLEPLVRQGTGTAHFYLVAPDAGALKKTHKLAQLLNTPRCLGVIETSKHRDTKTGDITGTVVHASSLISYVRHGENKYPITYVIVDDIIDGGRTFIELAKELRAMGACIVHLYVTHGFFTKGKSVFNGIIDEVHSVNDQSKFEWDKVSS